MVCRVRQGLVVNVGGGEETKKQTEDGSPCLAFKDPGSLLDRQPCVKTASAQPSQSRATSARTSILKHTRK
jgi:hypothetical protein